MQILQLDPTAKLCEKISLETFEQIKLIVTDPASYRGKNSEWKTAANYLKPFPNDYATYSEMLAALEKNIVGRNRISVFRLLDADLQKIIRHHFNLAAAAREFSKNCFSEIEQATATASKFAEAA
jgi:hypothetical protein